MCTAVRMQPCRLTQWWGAEESIDGPWADGEQVNTPFFFLVVLFDLSVGKVCDMICRLAFFTK